MSDSRSNPTVKRIMQEIKELQRDPSDQFIAEAFEDNLFEWHFVIRGAPDTDFAGGLYHGRILLPAAYPFRPPEFMFLTPNGRFQTNLKICLSISSHHPESWQPSWNIRTALTAIIAFMPTPSNGAVGGIDFSPAERKNLAAQAASFVPPSSNTVRAAQMARMHKELQARPVGSSSKASSSMSGGGHVLGDNAGLSIRVQYKQQKQQQQQQLQSTVQLQNLQEEQLQHKQRKQQQQQQQNGEVGGSQQSGGRQQGLRQRSVTRENASAGTQTSPRGQEGHNHPRGWIEQDKLGVTAVCLGIMLAIILLRKFLRSYGLESGVPLESGWEKAH